MNASLRMFNIVAMASLNVTVDIHVLSSGIIEGHLTNYATMIAMAAVFTRPCNVVFRFWSEVKAALSTKTAYVARLEDEAKRATQRASGMLWVWILLVVCPEKHETARTHCRGCACAESR